ncbi:serine/threonine-protein kinase Chk1-like isoform X2 [Artemia franciscana]|uniref:serine/threonine-protein kinase Chk1-like isoform X2 n=1 Tax=Artemia franciscana TaxID=6661 RepID=UPI0032DAF79D
MVKLLLNKVSGDAVAMKIVDLVKNANVTTSIKKEIAIHKKLNHPHIIKVYGNRKEQGVEYIFLEYASGGELFDRIEPDIGMKPQDAQKYFRHLISGVEYLHSLGIVHRDIKPENLLLDEHDNLKITDFGMATIFRMNGKDRMLDKQCGTLPYVAPEVLSGKQYHGEPADIWSCGVVLVAMLGGELPWDSPTNHCEDYVSWKECGITKQPWCKIENLALSILRRILNHSPPRRYKVSEIKQHQWFTKQFKDQGTPVKLPGTPLKKKIKLNRDSTGREEAILACSQPVHCDRTNQNHCDELQDRTSIGKKQVGLCSFSQPTNPEHMLLTSQCLGTQTQSGSNQTPLHRLVKRMTRCIMNTDFDKTRKELERLLDLFGYTWRECPQGTFTISCKDIRKMDLTFKANAMSLNGVSVLLDFRLSHGCGIDFKRHFLKIRGKLKPFISEVPMTWSLADATNTIP